jgi:hypothetical protein
VRVPSENEPLSRVQLPYGEEALLMVRHEDVRVVCPTPGSSGRPGSTMAAAAAPRRPGIEELPKAALESTTQ